MDNIIIIGIIVIIFIIILTIQFYPKNEKEKERPYHSTFTSALNIVDGVNTTYLDYSALAFRLNGTTILNLDASGNVNSIAPLLLKYKSAGTTSLYLQSNNGRYPTG